MQFGHDINKNRIKVSFTGQRALCPICNSELIAKCGEIYVWHWQHRHNIDCDPWKEHETMWHRQWKSKFPESCQEITIEREGEIHRADVLTPNKTVIEFQNSPISTSIIRIRENFYQNMVWVVNAIDIQNNFKIQSVVKSRLRMIESDASTALNRAIEEYDVELNENEIDIKENENESKSKCNSIRYNTTKLDKLIEDESSYDELAQKIINKLLD